MDKSLQTIDGKVVPLFPKEHETEPCRDINLLAENAYILLGNAHLILNDSRMILAPIDLNCGLAYCGKFEAITLGGLLEYWIHSENSRDREGNPLIHLAGSPLSGSNKCGVALPNGKWKTVRLTNFSGAYKDYLKFGHRYCEYIDTSEAYSLADVVKMLKEWGETDKSIDLNRENAILRQKCRILQQQNENHRAEITMLKDGLTSATYAMRRFVVQSHIEEFRKLYSDYLGKEKEAEKIKCRHIGIKQTAKRDLKNHAITQEEYISIKNRELEIVETAQREPMKFWQVQLAVICPEYVLLFRSPNDVKRLL